MNKTHFIFISLFFSLIFSSSLLFFYYLSTPVTKEYIPVYFFTEKGDSARLISTKLKEAGLIKSSYLFLFYIKRNNVDFKLKAGEYLLSKNMTINQILYYLTAGKTVMVKVTIPEGFTTEEIAKLVEEKGLGNSEIFLELVNEPSIFKFSYKLPPTFDGYLFPDTYYLDRNQSEKEIIQRMLDRFQQKVKPDYIAKANKLGYSLDDIINIAGMIEREAKVDSDRTLISAVLHNRLRIGMPLECDATVQFAHKTPKKRLYYKDLTVMSPYNTYIFKGLPPRPICNPGIKAIESALYPAKVNYIYYVLKKDGSHFFSSKLSEHQWAKVKYR